MKMRQNKVKVLRTAKIKKTNQSKLNSVKLKKNRPEPKTLNLLHMMKRNIEVHTKRIKDHRKEYLKSLTLSTDIAELELAELTKENSEKMEEELVM